MKELQTIKDLCVNVVEKEMEKKALTGSGFSVEEKQAIATSMKLLWMKAELNAGLRFVLGCLNDEWDLACEAAIDCNEKCNWEPSHSKFYTIINILLYCLERKTFKQCKDNEWFELMNKLCEEVFWGK